MELLLYVNWLSWFSCNTRNSDVNSNTFQMYKGTLTADKHFGFEGVAWYWHFVDVVWLLLFVLVYWI